MTPLRQLLSLLILTIFLVQCGTSPKGDSAFFEILIKADQKTYTPLDTLHLAVLTKLTLKADSIQWSAQSHSMGTVQVEGETLSLNDWPMGNHKLQALVYTTEGPKKISKEFTVVAAQKPQLYTYTILERFAHDINAYTQGLEFDGDDLYESTG